VGERCLSAPPSTGRGRWLAAALAGGTTPFRLAALGSKHPEHIQREIHAETFADDSQ
jgi:hypothetical protein